MNNKIRSIIKLFNIKKFYSIKDKGLNITKLKNEYQKNKKEKLKTNLYDNFRSYNSNKLIEINNRYNILTDNMNILELGSTPGSWSQVLNLKTKNSNILSIDQDNMIELEGINFLQFDITNPDIFIKIKQHFNNEKLDIILSDISPSFLGDLDTDFSSLAHLNKIILEIAFQNLKIGGSLWVKSIKGNEEDKLFNFLKIHFSTFNRIRLSTSRFKSSEFYYLGRNFKQNSFWFNLKKNLKKNIIDISEINKYLPIEAHFNIKNIFIRKQLYIRNGYDSLFLFEMYFYNKLLNGKEEKLKKEIDVDKLYPENMSFKEFEEYYMENINKYSYTRKFPRSYKEMVEIYEDEVPKLINKFNKSQKNEFELLDLDADLNTENYILDDNEEDEFYEDWDYLKQDYTYMKKMDKIEDDIMNKIKSKNDSIEYENKKESKQDTFDGFGSLSEADFKNLKEKIDNKEEFRYFAKAANIDNLNHEQFKTDLNKELDEYKNNFN